MSSEALRSRYASVDVCQVDGCEQPRRAAISIPAIGLAPVALCPSHYLPVARAYKSRDVGRSKWTPEARHEALVEAVGAAIGSALLGGDHGAA